MIPFYTLLADAPSPTIVPLAWSQFRQIADNVVAYLPTDNLIAILGGMVSLGIIFVLIWAFGRRALRSIVSAMTRGKMKI